MPHKSASPGKTSRKSKSATTRNDRGDGLDREEMISVAAYFRAEHRGFSGNDTLADWLDAEAEINAMLNNLKDVKVH